MLASVLLTWPVAHAFFRAIPSSRVAFDPCMQAFLLGWDWRSLSTGALLRVFDVPIFHPEPNTLAYMDHLLGEAAAAAPLLALRASLAGAYNFLFLGSFACSAWATYRLVRLFGVSRFGAFLAGFLFAFGPYRYANLDLLNQLQTQFLPLGILFGVRYLQRGRTRHLAGVAGTLVAQTYFGWYYAYYLVLALALLWLYARAAGWPRPAPARAGARRREALALGAGAILLVLPVVLPYVRERLLLPEFRRSLGQSALYSADLLDYLVWPVTTALGRWVPFARASQSYWPGLVTVVLAAVGVSGIWRRPAAPGKRRTWRSALQRWGPAGYFLVLAAAALVLSLGPILHVAGHRLWIPLPYAALYFVTPGFPSMRAPARLASLVLLALAVLAGLGYEEWRRRWAARGERPAAGAGARPLASTARTGRPALASAALPAALLLAAVACAWPRPLTTVELPDPARLPTVYAWLAAQPDSPPVLEVPVPARDADESETHALRQLYALYHGKPRLDGTSGFVSRRYKRFRAAMQGFPDEASLRASAELGARLVVVHYGDYPPAAREALRGRVGAAAALEPAARFGDDEIYRLRPGPSGAGG